MEQCKHNGYDGQCSRRARKSGYCWQHEDAGVLNARLAWHVADAARLAGVLEAVRDLCVRTNHPMTVTMINDALAAHAAGPTATKPEGGR